MQKQRALASRDILCDGLLATGKVRLARPQGAFYLFFEIDGHVDSRDLAMRLVDETAVGLSPGTGFYTNHSQFLRACFMRDPRADPSGHRPSGGLAFASVDAAARLTGRKGRFVIISDRNQNRWPGQSGVARATWATRAIHEKFDSGAVAVSSGVARCLLHSPLSSICCCW